MKYQANPVIVDAFKIVAIIRNTDEEIEHVRLDNADIVTPTPEMMSRMKPTVGDYWVIQSDGYIYLNPKEVFERKYSPLNSAAGA